MSLGDPLYAGIGFSVFLGNSTMLLSLFLIEKRPWLIAQMSAYTLINALGVYNWLLK